MKRNIQLLVATAGFVGSVLPGTSRAQCDPNVVWTLHRPTEEVAEIIITGNRAWIGGEGGVIRVEVDQVAGGSPEQIKITDVEALASNDVTCLAEDMFGNIWVGTKEDGVTVLDQDGNYIQDLTAFDWLYSDLVIAIGGHGSRMVVVSAESFSPQGALERGGFAFIEVGRDNDGSFTFTTEGIPPDLQVGQDVLALPSQIWFGTSGDGLWLWDDNADPRFRQVLTQAEGLVSSNVKKVLQAPHFDQSGRTVLWLGTGAGLQTYHPSSDSLDDVPGFEGRNILDMYLAGPEMYVLTEVGVVRDLYAIDLGAPFAAQRIPRATCISDTLYVPRDVAVDSSGRIVLGTLERGFVVLDGLSWHCPPPLGPHAPKVADLHLAEDRVLYFGTGSKVPPRTGNGVGVFDGTAWSSITREQGIIESNMTEVHVWGDGTVWFGTSISGSSGGLDRYFPDSGAIEHYRPGATLSRQTLGRNVRSIKEDPAGNLWVCYGQNPGGGLSLIEVPPAMRIKNYDFGLIYEGTTLLRDFDFDSRGRIWTSTTELTETPGQLYVLDPRGTLFDLQDDVVQQFNVSNQVADLGETVDLEIDSNDRIWIAGQKGLAVGQIDPGGGMFATWQRIIPTATQAGGRNPLPYTVMALDWEENVWLGTESAGLVRISKDLIRWTWFDQVAGCPLPDQSITGLHADEEAQTMWVGTAGGGIARIDLSGEGSDAGEVLRAEPYPNPWRPDDVGTLLFGNLPTDAPMDLRIYTVAGELVHEQRNVRGAKSWNGTNVGGFLVEAGVYVIAAVNLSTLEVYRDKVAVLK